MPTDSTHDWLYFRSVLASLTAFLYSHHNNLISDRASWDFPDGEDYGRSFCYLFDLHNSYFTGEETPLHKTLAALLRKSRTGRVEPVRFRVTKATYWESSSSQVSAGLLVHVSHDADADRCREQINRLLSYLLCHKNIRALTENERAKWGIRGVGGAGIPAA